MRINRRELRSKMGSRVTRRQSTKLNGVLIKDSKRPRPKTRMKLAIQALREESN